MTHNIPGAGALTHFSSLEKRCIHIPPSPRLGSTTGLDLFPHPYLITLPLPGIVKPLNTLIIRGLQLRHYGSSSKFSVFREYCLCLQPNVQTISSFKVLFPSLLFLQADFCRYSQEREEGNLRPPPPFPYVRISKPKRAHPTPSPSSKHPKPSKPPPF